MDIEIKKKNNQSNFFRNQFVSNDLFVLSQQLSSESNVLGLLDNDDDYGGDDGDGDGDGDEDDNNSVYRFCSHPPSKQLFPIEHFHSCSDTNHQSAILERER